MAWFKDEEERRKYRQWFLARANAPKHIGGKGSSGGSQFGPVSRDKKIQQWKERNRAGIAAQLGTRMGGHTGEEINITPSKVNPYITPGSKTDTWAMTKGGTGMRQTLHDPNPQRFMPPEYFARLQNMQNMAAFEGQVRGGGMPRRQKRHAPGWAAFDQNVADRRRDLGQMANWQTMQALPPELRLAYLQWKKQQEEEGGGNWIDPWGNTQPIRRHT